MSLLENNAEYIDLLNQIKTEIAETRTRAVTRVNSELILMYWRIGSYLAQGEWGDKTVDTLSRDIRAAYPGIKGFSVRNLKYMKKFAREVSLEIVQTVSAQLSWSHNVALLDKAHGPDQYLWYARAAIENGWSLSILEHQIDTHLYERQALSGKVSNFSRTLPEPDSELAQQTLKDEYIFDFITARQSLKEREVEDQMVDNVTQLLLELGTGFAFMGHQYHFVVGQEDFYIDLLFYNTMLHCYVVVELKNDRFRPEYAGKLSFYISAINGELRREADGPTIGLLLCKTKDDVVAEYSLADINQPIGVSEYRIGDELPGEYGKYLPSPADLQARL